ncbi:venom serine carboxypeptidase-like [Euwallacea similis]|uniref:venom serine carboxypeptidase-like n=1 Tax=Euwallacea similis TaxID=1736056 RepID=UPI00344F623B
MGQLGVFLVLATISTLAAAKFPFYNIKPFTHKPVKDVGEPLILTPLIEANLTEKAKELSKVNSSVFNNIESYSGYFTVDKPNNGNLFFWFFPSAGNYNKDPVLLWLQGGPGVTSLYGLFTENGPFLVQNDTLLLREYSWHKNYSVLYIDQPIGTGYSFSNGSLVNNQTQVGEHLYSALYQFFTVFSELQNNSFFISGESYGGKYVPAISYTIHKKNPSSALFINLQGIIIGNGLSDPEHQFKYGELLYQLGLIDQNALAEFQDIQDLIISLIKEDRYQEATDSWNEMVDELFFEKTGLSNIYNYIANFDYISSDWENFIVEDSIREALHVGNEEFVTQSSEVYEGLYADITRTVAPWVSELLSHYRTLIYNGQLDIIVGYVLTENYLQNLNFSGAEEYKTAERQIWKYADEVAGYVKTAGNLTEVLVRDASHMVPADQPAWAWDLVSSFINNVSIANH